MCLFMMTRQTLLQHSATVAKHKEQQPGGKLRIVPVLGEVKSRQYTKADCQGITAHHRM